MTPLYLLLQKVPRAVWGWLLVIALALASLTLLYRHAEAQGELKAKTLILAQKAVHDSIRVVQYDTVVRHDTVRLTRTLARYDTVRAVLNVHDTVAVERFVAVADSTVRACRETVSAFALSCAAKDTLIATQKALLALRPQPAPPALSWKQRAGYLVLGALLDEGIRRR